MKANAPSLTEAFPIPAVERRDCREGTLTLNIRYPLLNRAVLRPPPTALLNSNQLSRRGAAQQASAAPAAAIRFLHATHKAYPQYIIAIIELGDFYAKRIRVQSFQRMSNEFRKRRPGN